MAMYGAQKKRTLSVKACQGPKRRVRKTKSKIAGDIFKNSHNKVKDKRIDG